MSATVIAFEIKAEFARAWEVAVVTFSEFCHGFRSNFPHSSVATRSPIRERAHLIIFPIQHLTWAANRAPSADRQHRTAGQPAAEAAHVADATAAERRKAQDRSADTAQIETHSTSCVFEQKRGRNVQNPTQQQLQLQQQRAYLAARILRRSFRTTTNFKGNLSTNSEYQRKCRSERNQRQPHTNKRSASSNRQTSRAMMSLPRQCTRSLAHTHAQFEVTPAVTGTESEQ